MRKTNKVLATVMALGMLAAAPLAACGGTKKDATITYLEIACANMGLGSEWLYKAAADFEEANKETSFADGKTGVKVEITDPTSGISAYFNSIASYPQHIVFTEGGSNLRANMANDYFADITDVVQESTDGAPSIESKLYDHYKENFKGDDGKYYALPHAEYYGGMAYNRDVFENRNALIADATCEASHVRSYTSKKYKGLGAISFVKGSSIGQTGCVLSAGPDGKPGNEDDGLPASLEELILLCDYLRNDVKIAPIALSGEWPNMINYLICGLWASIAGEEQMRNYYGLNGEIEVVDYVKNNDQTITYQYYENEPLIAGIDYVKKPKIKKEKITTQTAWLGNSMVAKYYAIAIAEILQREGFLSEGALKGTISHTGAQGFLINSSNELAMQKGNTEEVAMLIDGSYFINETTTAGNFDSYRRWSGALENSDIRWMALPTSYTSAEREVEGYVAHASTLMDINVGCAVVNGRYKNDEEAMKVAKAFLKFFYSDEQMKQYTKISRQFLSLKYDFDDTELKELDPFYQSLWKIRDHEKGSNVVYVSTKAGSDASTVKVFEAVAPSIFTALQSNNLKPTAPGSGSSSPYGIFIRTDNTLDGQSKLYKYGTKFIFENLAFDEVKWQGNLVG